MSTDTLTAIINIINSETTVLGGSLKSVSNRANLMGDALEEYIQEAYSGTIGETNRDLKLKRIDDVFSYTGNNSNPPDGMIKGGEAIEVKKIESRGSQLQLNSSNPKSKLYKSDPRLNSKAISAEEWTEKDFVYVVGFIDKKSNSLKELAFIDSSLYCADKEIYDRPFTKIKKGILEIPNVEFNTDTKELGRVNKVDPLGIASLRIRGMWLLDNPFKVFSDIYKPQDGDFNLFALISDERFENSDNKDELVKMSKSITNLTITDKIVKNPNNPAKLKHCKKITFHF